MVSEFIIYLSVILSVLFTIFGTIRLWKVKKISSIFLASTSIFSFGFEIIKVAFMPSYGSALTVIINIILILSFISFFYAIIMLWRFENN